MELELLVVLRMGSTDLVAILFKECKDMEEGYDTLCRYIKVPRFNTSKNYIPSTLAYLIFAALIKIVCTIFTFGTRVPAGVL